MSIPFRIVLVEPPVPSDGSRPGPCVGVGTMSGLGGISPAPAVLVMATEMTGGWAHRAPPAVGVGPAWMVLRCNGDTI